MMLASTDIKSFADKMSGYDCKTTGCSTPDQSIQDTKSILKCCFGAAFPTVRLLLASIENDNIHYFVVQMKQKNTKTNRNDAQRSEK